jgi:excinuclease ABC subunit B
MQVMGRAARHLDGRVIMYADTVTGSMARAIKETKRRRKIQEDYNREHRVTPRSIQRAIRKEHLHGLQREEQQVPTLPLADIPKDELSRLAKEIEAKMNLAASNLEFEKAALLRDQLKALQDRLPRERKTPLYRRGRGKTIKRQRPGRR